MKADTAIITIVYDGSNPDTYEGAGIHFSQGRQEWAITVATGNPQADYETALEVANKGAEAIFASSTVDDFFADLVKQERGQ